MKLIRVLGIALVLGVLYFARSMGWVDFDDSQVLGDAAPQGGSSGAPTAVADPSSSTTDDTQRVASLFDAQRSGEMVRVHATVKKTLPDDNEGSRHQRFIIELSNGHTLLVAHNIDLAPRVPLERDDSVEVRGQFEWNPDGGVLHWTHLDPRGTHDEGWIRHEGQTYE